MSGAVRAVAFAVAVGAAFVASHFCSPASAGADAPALLELLRADGYRHARIVGKGALVVVDAERRGRPVLLALHDGGASTPPPLVLDGALAQHDPEQLSAQLAPLFGRAELVDIIVDLRSGGADLGWTSTHHYVVRVGLVGDELVCDFESDSRRNGAESSSGWSGRLRKLRDAPLAFELVQTFSRAEMGGTEHWNDPPPKKTHFVLDERGRCSATVEPPSAGVIGIGTIGVPKKRRPR